ncbi:hypothetical protein FIBSPDRAFT_1044840 [Athelia psychrophila]|uniref:ABC transporter domain-containing protein n=1 Tax=Athelia psychrophila TaxID=1759441 RepID=A0A166J825_9AGAM|nr:hypothetical protein FIBSPDRAFT_1044840 [Fibularhizoctonia sp. CBS 109695]
MNSARAPRALSSTQAPASSLLVSLLSIAAHIHTRLRPKHACELRTSLSSFLVKRSVRIQKGPATKHMVVIDELVATVKFTRFFAWEGQWINHALDAREVDDQVDDQGPYELGHVLAPLDYVAHPRRAYWVLHTKIALDRIAVYLDEDEVSDQVSTLKDLNREPVAGDEDAALGIENGSFKWDAVDEAKEKERAVAAKSTSPTRAATTNGAAGREDTQPGGRRIIMSKNPPKVDEHGLMYAISNAAQSTWLRYRLIKDNILFGYPYDEERDNAIAECCVLQADLSIFDDTEIGARGVSLSGSQKMRGALARAVAFVGALLDDVIPQDSHTSRFLFEKLLQGPLLANRTVILVTHHVELMLPSTHYLVRMLDSRIDTQGTVEELRSRGVLDDIVQDEAVDTWTAKPTGETKKPRKMFKDEAKEYATVKWFIYNTYSRASSYWTWGAVLTVLVVVAQLLGVGEKLWIRQWGNAYGKDYNEAAVYSSFPTPRSIS